jgi:hypothetical protein
MVLLENSVVIDRTPEVVFDYLGDLRNELDWNPKMKSVSLVSGEPIGVGSRYRARWAGSPDNLVEYLRYERPHAWASVARSPMMDVHFSAAVAPYDEGSRLSVRMELVPRGPMRLLAPMLARWMQSQELANMRYVKQAMESRP